MNRIDLIRKAYVSLITAELDSADESLELDSAEDPPEFDSDQDKSELDLTELFPR